MKEYVDKTQGWTGAEIEAICRSAGINAIKKYYGKKDSKDEMIITKEDFDLAMINISESINKPIKKEESNKEKENKKEKEDKK